MSTFQRKGAFQIAEAANRLIDPVLQRKAGKGLLILSVDLLQRSVAVEVDWSIVTAA